MSGERSGAGDIQTDPVSHQNDGLIEVFMYNLSPRNFILPLLFPCIACIVQLFFWDKFQPFIWFLFYPAVFFSAQIGGRWGGFAATILSAALVTFFFVEPVNSFQILNPVVIYSISIFIVMGFLFSNFQERFKHEQNKLKESESDLRKMNEGLEELVNERALALQQANQRFENLVENMLEGVQILGFDWSYLYLNRTAEIHNRRPNDELLGRKYTEMWPSIESTPVFAVIKRCMEERVVGYLENEFAFPDGHVGWFELRIEPIPEGVFILSSDISERKYAQNILQESEARFSKIFHAGPIGINIFRLSDNCSYDVNDAFLNIIGYSREEVVGRSAAELNLFIDPQIRTVWVKALRELKGVRNQDAKIRRKSGEIRDALASIDVIDMNGEPMGLVIMMDITERKQSEEMLRYHAHLLDNVNDAVVASDKNYGLTAWNTAAEHIYGWKASEVLGRNGREVIQTIFSDQDKEKVLAAITANGFYRGEATQVRKDGTRFPVDISSIVLHDKQGQITGYLSVNRDITERKLAQEQLLKTLEELQRSNSELEQFAYVASHDLQEPLRAVAGMVQLLQKRYRGQLDERADEYISLAMDGANRMQTLITDLLEYSRVDRRGNPIQPTDANAALGSALRNLHEAIQKSGATVTNETLPTVKADASQFIQLFQNLIGNAIKFRNEQPPQIHIEAEDLPDAWHFSVRDNGIGIEPQYFERIFLVFQRLHTRREYSGTGIGLSICKKIVERHGGRIWVESEPGQGATFHFTIPHRS